MARRYGNFRKETRRHLLKEAEGRCETCGRRTKDLQVHHRLPRAMARRYHPEIPEEIVAAPENGKVLCPDCHAREDRISQDFHDLFAISLMQAVSEQKSKDPVEQQNGSKTRTRIELR